MPVTITPHAQRQLESTPRAIQARIYGVVARLEQWPDVSGVKALRGEWQGAYRIRTGDFRVVFTVSGADVQVVKIGDRKDVYLD